MLTFARHDVEMVVAMLVGMFALGAVLTLAIALGGVMDVGGQMAVQHTLMFPAMLAAMLLRRSEYV